MRFVPSRRTVVTVLAFVFGTCLLGGWFQANVQEWARATGSDQFLVLYVGSAMDRLAQITQSPVFLFLAAVFAGGAWFLWADFLVRRWSAWAQRTTASSIFSLRTIDRKLASMTLMFIFGTCFILSAIWFAFERGSTSTVSEAPRGDARSSSRIETPHWARNPSAVSNDELRTRTFELTPRMRVFQEGLHEAFSRLMLKAPSDPLKMTGFRDTGEGKLFDKEWTELSRYYTAEADKQFRSDALALRGEMERRLGRIPPSQTTSRTIWLDRDSLAGPHPLSGAADYLEELARRLPP